MKSTNIIIKETTKNDLDNVILLWNNGEVMQFVGFPEGLGITEDKMESWFEWVIKKPQRCHYSIYENEIGYCGESFYNVDGKGAAALDTKLLSDSRGKGIGYKALEFAIERAFDEGKAKLVYVVPSPHNKKACQLYEKLGFVSKSRPTYLEDGETYLEITST